MHQEIDYTTVADIQMAKNQIMTKQLLEEHSIVLDKYGLQYKASNNYYEIREPSWIQGWIIDISVIPIQFENLLETIIPMLMSEKIPFKVAKDAGIGRSIMDGDLGFDLLGKFVTIYPLEESHALDLAIQLIQLTKNFKGPEILTDRRLRNVVYVRYGACKGVSLINESGIEEKHIYNSHGDLVKDPCSIPFLLPEGIDWPFYNIVPAKTPQKETVLQERYRPMATLKIDAKGSVKKGLYLEKYWRIKWCIIKEGKQYMLGDSKGRDMADRMRWQFELHKEMEGILPLPKIYALFEENGDTYLIMEFIKGKPLFQFIASILKGRTWNHLDSFAKISIFKVCINMLEVIERMHANGYIHRDITPANFLIGNKQQLWMIDLELAYCERRKRPQWPFRLGTFGFMSPEQEATLTPSIKEDIYAIGALLIFIFTGLMPTKFLQKDPETLKVQLNFFIQDAKLIDLIVNCMEKDPHKRPNISALKANIQNSQIEEITIPTESRTKITPEVSPVDRSKLRTIIQNSINSLIDPTFLNSDGLWVSLSGHEDNFVYDHNKSASAYAEFYQGISGVTWLLARAKKLKFSVAHCKKEFDRNLDFARRKFLDNSPNAPAGLYFGSAGLAMTMVEGIDCDLISNNYETLDEIRMHFNNKNVNGCGIAKGLAGQGMALLRSLGIMNDQSTHSLLEEKVELLLTQQGKDGSWLTLTNRSNKPIKCTGFGYGVAGIASFLMSYIQQYKDDSLLREAVIKAINWLCRQARKKNKHIIWSLHTETKSYSYSFQDGFAGIVLTLLQAYEVFRDPICRDLAEDCLRGYESCPVSTDITQVTGLAGFGEVYLEAERILSTGEWQERIDWIEGFILHHFLKQKDDSCYWMPNETPFTTAGFMEGNSGIIHFLMRCYKSKGLSHPLLTQ